MPSDCVIDTCIAQSPYTAGGIVYLAIYERVSEKIKTIGNTKIDGTRINMWTVNGSVTAPVKRLPDFADDADDGYLTL